MADELKPDEQNDGPNYEMNYIDELLTRANLTTRELGQQLGVDMETVRLWRVQGRLPRNVETRSRLAEIAARHSIAIPQAAATPLPPTDKNFIREIRAASGWTQAEMAQQLGISFPSIQKLEAGGWTPKTAAAFDRLVRLGRKVNIEVHEIRPPKAEKPVPVRDSIRVYSPGEKRGKPRRAGLMAIPEQTMRTLLQAIAEEYQATGELSQETLQRITQLLKSQT